VYWPSDRIEGKEQEKGRLLKQQAVAARWALGILVEWEEPKKWASSAGPFETRGKLHCYLKGEQLEKTSGHLAKQTEVEEVVAICHWDEGEAKRCWVEKNQNRTRRYFL
jgi:hypothetical protein